jgi:prevent-host-death family protein
MRKSRVGVRALKNDLSRWVARARGGEEVIVTDRGTPVARLVPMSVDDPLERLIAEGVIEPATKTHRRALPRHRLRLRGRGPSMSDYVIDGRR